MHTAKATPFQPPTELASLHRHHVAVFIGQARQHSTRHDAQLLPFLNVIVGLDVIWCQSDIGVEREDLFDGSLKFHSQRCDIVALLNRVD